ncbi:P68 family surface lipoprotein [Mycoplasmopsis agassizii]|uniref:P68 family surface lipoprotein n=1 Tax=Mycoplasmopsis agassizii TaxID=33922 RepID=UPI003526F383
MKKIKKLGIALGASLAAAATLTVIACSTTPAPEPTKPADKIVFATAQSKVYPLTIALNKLVPLYNEQQKGTTDFLEVKFQDSEASKATSESQLGANTISAFETNSNVANLLLGNKGTAFLINQYGKLLDLSKSEIKPGIFPTKILNGHNKLPGQSIDANKIYNIPFDVTDVDSLAFNLDIMWKLFTIIKGAGGTVDETTDLYKSAQKASTSGHNGIPANSLFSIIEAKSSDAFKDYTVNADTFKSIKSAQDFAKKVYENVKFPEDKITKSMTDARVFALDYQQDTLFKDINNRLDGKFLWDLKATAESDKKKGASVIDFTFKTDANTATQFKTVWDEYMANNLQTELKTIDSDKKSFFSVQYMSNNNQWASWEMRKYNAAFTYVAAVGIEQSILSPTSIAFFDGKNSDDKANWAHYEDIEHHPQLMLSTNQLNTKTYLEGGSSLIALTKNDVEDKATIKFLNWLYKGKVKVDKLDGSGKEEISVNDFIIRESGYIIPTSENLTQAKVTELKTSLDTLNTEIKTLNDKADKTDAEKTKLNKLITRRSYTKTAYISLLSLMKFIDSSDVHLLNFAVDKTASEIANKIASLMLETTKEGGSKITGDKAFEEISKLVK